VKVAVDVKRYAILELHARDDDDDMHWLTLNSVQYGLCEPITEGQGTNNNSEWKKREKIYNVGEYLYI